MPDYCENLVTLTHLQLPSRGRFWVWQKIFKSLNFQYFLRREADSAGAWLAVKITSLIASYDLTRA